MALSDLKSAYSFYDKRNQPFINRTEKTNFIVNKKNFTIATSINGFNDFGFRSTFGGRVSANEFDLRDQGTSKRRVQLGTGTKFPIGPFGDIHEFDIVRTGFHLKNRYENTYNSLSNAGLADTYIKDSPIDDMYNIVKVRDESSDRLFFREPFILRGIQRNNNSKTQKFGPITSLEIPRGGLITNANRSVLDVLRITKFLTTPKGLSFIAKQNVLQFMNPNTEGTTGVTQLPFGTDSSKIFSTKNLLKNIGGVGFGRRNRRHGTVPTSLQIFDKSKYEDVLERARRTVDEKLRFNRLVKLHGELIDKKNALFDQYAKKTIKVLSGIGGPNSQDGLGGTDIKRYVITTSAPNAENTPSTQIETFDKRKLKFQDQIENESGNSFSMPEKTNVSLKDKLEDFDGIGTKLDNVAKSEDTIKNYKALAYSQIRQINKNRTNTKILDPTRSPDTTKSGDAQFEFDVTKTQLFEKFKEIGKDISKDRRVDTIHDDPNHMKDFIDLRFTDSKLESSGIKFLAYLNSLSDDLQQEKELSDKNNTGIAVRTGKVSTIIRSISIEFTVAAHSPAELKSIYSRLNRLKAISVAKERNKGIQTLTVGDLAYKVKGYIENVGTSWDAEIPWEISPGSQVPLALNINVEWVVDKPGVGKSFAFGRNGVIS